MAKEKKNTEYANAFGSWLNRTTATLFFVLLTLKVVGATTVIPLSWVLVFTPMFVRWAVLAVCLLIVGVSLLIEEQEKKKNQ